MHEQYSIPQKTATTETMSRAQEAKSTRRPRFPQRHVTYKIGSAANIPIRNVLVESRRSSKHVSLRKSRRIGVVLLFIIGVVAILDIQKNGVRFLVS